MVQDEARMDAGQGVEAGQETCRYEVRFTRSDGIRGWLQARGGRVPMYGAGTVGVLGPAIALHGWQRTWLGVPAKSEILLVTGNVRNVVRDDGKVRFECKLGHRWRSIEAACESESAAERLRGMLPATKTPGFDEAAADLHEFNRRLDAVSGKPWVTPLLVAANAAAFVLVAYTSGGPFLIDVAELLRWGGNGGLLTTHGEWWRLFTATFLHVSIAHVGFNMWALWNVGRLTERLYGSWTFLGVYVASGVLASLASTVWDPTRLSVGASGAVFGVFGAFLAYLWRRSMGVPGSVIRAHRVSTLLFVAFNLFSGAIHPAIDNAAHVAGLVSGFLAGWLLARPLDESRTAMVPAARLGVVGAIAALALFAGIRYVGVDHPERSPSYALWRAEAWYPPAEAEGIRTWQAYANDAQAGIVSMQALADGFRKDVLPFWNSAAARLAAASRARGDRVPSSIALAREFAELRRDWAKTLIKAGESGSQEDLAKATEFARTSLLLQGRIERARLRDFVDHRPLGLRMEATRAWRMYRARHDWTCVKPPAGAEVVSAYTDAKSDGPARRQAAGCEAQRLFSLGDFAALDNMLERAVHRRGDLPDGSSTLAGVVAGLDDLFEYGDRTPLEFLASFADWRREFPASVHTDVFEAQMLMQWAWSARGSGSWTSVSEQSRQEFAMRNEMAAATLDELGDRGAASPVYFQNSMNLAVARSEGLQEVRDLFEAGYSRYPDYFPLHRAILRALMPRWSGSAGEVADFIDRMSLRSTESTYARLYWFYALLEGDEVDIFEEGRVNWPRIQAGFRELLRQHPGSDYVLNSYASLACRRGDAVTYAQLRRDVGRRVSATAWTDKYSIAVCDKNFDLARDHPVPEKIAAMNSFLDSAGNRMTETDAAWVRQQVKTALDIAEPLKGALGAYHQQHGRMPAPDVLESDHAFKPVDAIGVRVAVGLGGSVKMSLKGGPLDGRTFSWTPTERDGVLTWSCAQEAVPAEYLAPPCR